MGGWETDQEVAINAFVDRLNSPLPLYVSDFFADGDDDGIPRVKPDSSPPAPDFRYFDDLDPTTFSGEAREFASNAGALVFATLRHTDNAVVVV